MKRGQNKTSEYLTCLYTNADQLFNKLSELKILILKEKPDIIAVTELKPKNTRYPLKTEHILLPGFQGPIDNLDKEGRGVGIYIREGLEFSVLDANENFPQSIWVSLKFSVNHYVTFGCVYRSPSSTVEENANLNRLIKEKLSLVSPTIMVVGDFNYPDINWQNMTCDKGPTHPATLFLETFKDTLGVQLVTEPTRHREGQRSTLVDLIMTNKPEVIQDEVKHLPGLGKSDHDVLKIIFDTPDVKTPEPPRPLRYVYHSADYEGMREELKNMNLNNQILNLETEEAWNVIKTTLRDLRNKFVPTRRVVIGQSKKLRPLWMNTKALRKVRKKHQAYRRYLKTKEGTDYQEYKKCRNTATNEIKRAVRAYERKVAKDAKGNPKAFWAYYKNLNSQSSQIPTLIDDTGAVHNTDYEKAQVLNEYFASVFTKEDLSSSPKIPPRRVSSQMTPLKFTEEEVLKVLSNINPNKSPGPDEIHPKLVYELRNELAQPLTTLFNGSVISGKYPSDWREATVVPLHKKGSKADPGNYRPVSLTSVICKLLEKLIKNSMMSHLTSNDLISDNQHGFVNKRSCTTNLLESLEYWVECIEEKAAVDIVFLDFAKAFDTVPHVRLIGKLVDYGFCNRTITWIREFLKGRTQVVKVNNVMSSKQSVASGVPQGSVLGPVLFVIYINDLPEVTDSPANMFADDTKTYEKIKQVLDSDKLQNSIISLQGWGGTWQMGYNLIKCKHMRLNGNILPPNQYSMRDANGHQHSIETVSVEKDLGVNVDNNLNFETHIDNITKTAYRVLGTIKRTIKYMDKISFLTLYKSLVRSHLEYAQEVWSPKRITDKRKLENVQRRATRLLPQLRGFTYYDRLVWLGLPTLEHRRLRGDMITLFKITHGYIRTNLSIPYSTNRRTRGHPFKLESERKTSRVGRQFFTSRVVKEWNKLPEAVVSAPSVNSFKSRLDDYWKRVRDPYQTSFRM